MCKPLAGRTLVLYPDLKGFERWSAKRKELAAFCCCTISSFLEESASDGDKVAGLDLADYFLTYSPREFAKMYTHEGLPAVSSCEYGVDRVEKCSAGRRKYFASFTALVNSGPNRERTGR